MAEANGEGGAAKVAPPPLGEIAGSPLLEHSTLMCDAVDQGIDAVCGRLCQLSVELEGLQTYIIERGGALKQTVRNMFEVEAEAIAFSKALRERIDFFKAHLETQVADLQERERATRERLDKIKLDASRLAARMPASTTRPVGTTREAERAVTET
jgi:hypothetical protein